MITNFRLFLICLGFALATFSGSFLPQLETKNNQRIFFSEDDENLLTLERFEDSFGNVDNLIIALTGNYVYETRFLDSLKSLTELAWHLPYASRSQSLINFQYTEATKDGLIIRDLIPNPLELQEDELAEIKNYAANEQYINHILVGENDRTAGVLVTFQLPRLQDSKEIPEVMAALEQKIIEFKTENPSLEIHVSGTMATDYAFVQASKRDLRTLIPLCFLLMLIVIGVFAGGFRAALATGVCGLLAIVFSMGWAAKLGIPLSSATAIAPIIILTLTIAHSVHILDNFIKQTSKGSGIVTAAQFSFNFNYYPIFIATLTTAVGFLTFNFSKVPPFRDLGNLAAIGTFAAFFYSVFFLPALLSYSSVNKNRTLHLYKDLLPGLANSINRRKLLWGVASIILTAGVMAGCFKNELNDVILHYFDESIQYRTDTDFVVKNLTGLYQIHYILDSGKPSGISNPKFLEDVEIFSDWYRNQPKTVSIASFSSVLKRLNMNLHEGDPKWYRLPESHDEAAQYLLLYEMSVPYGLDVNTEVNIDKSKLRITVSFETMSSRELVQMNDRAEAWAAENTQNIKSVTGTGIAVMFARISAVNMKSMLKGTVVALLGISVILIVAFRSLRLGLLSLIPNLFPLGISFGLWGYFVGQIGLSLSVVSSMTLGIIVDDTVHFMSKYHDANKAGLVGLEAIRYTYEAVGQALIVTSISLVCGFLVLTLSPFYLNASLGLLAAIVILVALICDLLLLPSLLLLRPGRKLEN